MYEGATASTVTVEAWLRMFRRGTAFRHIPIHSDPLTGVSQLQVTNSTPPLLACSASNWLDDRILSTRDLGLYIQAEHSCSADELSDSNSSLELLLTRTHAYRLLILNAANKSSLSLSRALTPAQTHPASILLFSSVTTASVTT